MRKRDHNDLFYLDSFTNRSPKIRALSQDLTPAEQFFRLATFYIFSAFLERVEVLFQFLQ